MHQRFEIVQPKTSNRRVICCTHSRKEITYQDGVRFCPECEIHLMLTSIGRMVEQRNARPRQEANRR